MNPEIRRGKWLQFVGRVKRAWGRFWGIDELESEGEALILKGAFEESLGVAKRRAVAQLSDGVDRLAATTKRLARSI